MNTSFRCINNGHSYSPVFPHNLVLLPASTWTRNKCCSLCFYNAHHLWAPPAALRASFKLIHTYFLAVIRWWIECVGVRREVDLHGMIDEKDLDSGNPRNILFNGQTCIGATYEASMMINSMKRSGRIPCYVIKIKTSLWGSLIWSLTPINVPQCRDIPLCYTHQRPPHAFQRRRNGF